VTIDRAAVTAIKLMPMLCYAQAESAIYRTVVKSMANQTRRNFLQLAGEWHAVEFSAVMCGLK
jgi:hypothetical protein